MDFVEFILEDNVLNEIFENKFPSKITRYMVLQSPPPLSKVANSCLKRKITDKRLFTGALFLKQVLS